MARHHYVPKFYLKPWCGSDGHLNVCRKKADGTLEQKRRVPRGTGYIDGLYICEPEIRRLKDYKWANAVEEQYSKLESKAAKIRDKFLSGIPPSALDAHERKTWAMFVATLEYRSPRKVREIESDAKDHILAYNEHLRLNSQDVEHTERVISSINTDAVAANAARATPLRFADQLSQVLHDLQWVMITITQGMEFITADYPIAHLHHKEQRVLTSLPLSPEKLFVAGATDFSTWTPDLVAMTSMAVNLQIISQGPNFIYSTGVLTDGELFRLKKAASDCLTRPGESDDG